MLEKEDPKDYEVYNFNDSGIGESWLIGTDKYEEDESNFANAFIGGYKKCPVNIIVPRSLTNKEGVKRPVEVVGQFAYDRCSYPSLGSNTKSVFVTKQVKVIKRYGFGGMYNVESFQIEEGSVLESIESSGLRDIGWITGREDASKRGTLTLPSTLSSVAYDGIYQCDLFKTIIYCGTYSLSNHSTVNSINGVKATEVKVTNQYSASTIFNRTALKNSPEEVQDHCLLSSFRTEHPKEVDGVVITGWGNTSRKWCPNSLSIPDFIDGLPVRAIKEGAFENCPTGGAIVLPKTLKKVGAKAFAGTANVIAIFASSSELEIGAEAFRGCGKNANHPLRVSLPSNVLLNESAFLGSNIEELSIS